MSSLVIAFIPVIVALVVGYGVSSYMRQTIKVERPSGSTCPMV